MLVLATMAGTGLVMLTCGGWLTLGFLSTVVASTACMCSKVNEPQQSDTSRCVVHYIYIWRCHSNIVTKSSFNSISAVMNS